MCEKHTKHIKSLTDENTRKREDKVMSGHSKFANIKHKKEKMMLQKVKSLRLSVERSQLQ